MATADEFESVRQITVNDLIDVVAAGMRDFRAAPQYGFALGGLYVLAGWLIIWLLMYISLPYLVYPMAMGFVLIAPFAAVGFYAVSDLLERGETVSWAKVLGAMREAMRHDLRWMSLVTGFSLVIWLDIAALLFFGLMGFTAFGPDFLNQLFTTPGGLILVVLGNVSGALIALSIFSISVVSFPMLFDRDVDFVTAMVTSVKLVIANKVTMIIWCALIGILTGICLLSAFIGFLFVMPVIGHASWHLYKRAVAPGEVVASGAAEQVGG